MVLVCYISRLPNDILKAIFCRIPIASLINCWYVCKSWHQILKDSNVIGDIHLSTKNPTTLFLYLKKEKLYWLEFNGQHLHFDLAATIIRKPFWHLPKFVFLNSCKGLLCLCQDYDTLRIINPITSEYINLPSREEDQGRRYFPSLCGIGFDPKTQKFKVVKTITSGSGLKSEVCTIGDGTWRSTRGLTSGDFSIDSLGAFINGSLHCLFRSESNLRICAFDCQSETFKQLPLPPIHDDYRPINVGATEKFLYFSSYSVEVTGNNIFNVSVWMMEEYGVIESWTEMKGRQNGFKLDGMMFKNVYVLENGSVLLHLPPCFVIYHPPNGMFQKFGPNQEIQSTISPILHTPSFASIKDMVGDGLKILKAKDAATKLKAKKKWISPLEVCFFLALFLAIYIWIFK